MRGNLPAPAPKPGKPFRPPAAAGVLMLDVAIDRIWKTCKSQARRPPTATATQSLGRLLATPAALAECKRAGVVPFALIARHAKQDWGDVCATDRRLNDEALIDGGRLLSSYTPPTGVKLWLITEAADDNGDRAANHVTSR